MSETKKDNKTIIIAVLFVVIGIIGYFLYQQSQKETIGLQIGDASISATVSK